MRKHLLVIALSGLLAFSVDAQSSQSDEDELWQEDEWSMDEWDEAPEQSYTFTGFVEFAAGSRLANDRALDTRRTLADVRAQIQWDYALANSKWSLVGDLYYDGVRQQTRGQLREAAWQGNLSFLGDWGQAFDAKLGQQVLTWGTGDYVFLNDMFAKDYQSFFAGREDEYLKAPSLSAKFSGYFDAFNLDVVITPEFTPDNYINGDFFSFYSPEFGDNIAPGFDVNPPLRPESPEYALRIFKSIGSIELAGYAYRGFHKSPNAATIQGEPTFSALNVYGASMITSLGGGLFNAEYAYYASKDDERGDNPLIPNSQTRLLLGYEQELVKNLTGSVQWYIERHHDYQALLNSSLSPDDAHAQSRIWLTQRLVYRAMQQTLTLNLFNFYSTTDEDGYIKFQMNYSPVDSWRLSAGFNLFHGQSKRTFFGQFEDASNAFVRYRYFY